jgi:cytosine/adenosine deaminase-related metal-dependent hydrolase
VVTLDPRRTVYPTGAVAIEGRRIAAVGPEADIAGAFRASRVLDAGGACVHPGFLDAHFHVNQHAARGIQAVLNGQRGSPVNFADWKAALGDEDERAGAALACLDLLRNGYSGFIDGGTTFEPEAVATAAEATGLRGWIADPYLWDHRQLMDFVPTLISPSLEARVPFSTERALRQLGSQLHRNRSAEGLVRGFVALYGLGTASDELQRAAKACADQHGVACFQHVAYSPAMTEEETRRRTRPGIIHLAELGVLDHTATLVHVNIVTDAEIDRLREARSSVVWCPPAYFLTAAPSGVRGRMGDLLRSGIVVALGTDGATHCAVGDTACLAFHAAAVAGDTLAPATILEMLTLNPARAIAADRDVGSLEPGKRADVVIRRAGTPDAQPAVDPVFQLAVLSRTPSVDTVIVDGRIVLRAGRSTLVDEEVVFADVRASVARMLGRLGLRSG